jgi:hypothetical protein
VTRTPRARALIGCLAYSDGATLNDAIKLAGYDIKSALPLAGRFRPGARLVLRGGRVVKLSSSASDLSRWLLRLGCKLAVIPVERRRVRSVAAEVRAS